MIRVFHLSTSIAVMAVCFPLILVGMIGELLFGLIAEGSLALAKWGRELS